ncbi:MAG TPA: glycosyltransferase family 39 protein, partial [Bacteroidales bacterium]|nr:glycosyltransferase family 39 protein [Bacteroidales bacterium]
MPYKKYLSLIIIFSLIIRGFLAYFLELGNDEVYYWTYALFPDLSHFDHPPMVGFLIQLTTLNLWLDHEFFIRLGAVLLGGINTLLIFHITRRISGSQAGIYAALLYNASVYCFVLCGIFILPDTPQVTFWLLSLLIMVTILPAKEIQKKDGWLMLLLGITIGLGMLSKYTTVFLWAATGFYILFYNRTWLNKWQLYFAVLLSIIIFSPVIFWNYQHNFISFTFHGDRVSLFEPGFRPDYFFTELGGQILYNNPVNFIIIIIVLIALARKKFSIDDEIKRILLLSSLPLIGIFLFVALFRQTLPHWSGPGYLALIVLSGIFFAEKHKNMPVFFPGLIKTSILVLVLGLSVAVAEIK